MHTGTPLGTLERLWRYPVKSLAAQPLERVRLNERGLAGDRAGGLFVATEEHARHGKTYRGKEHELLHTVDTPAAALELASLRGIVLDVRDDGPYFDASPVSIVFDTWLATLEALVCEAIDPLRFRPNVFAIATPGFGAREADLVGSDFTIGDVRLHCTSTIARCVTPGYDVATGKRDRTIARAIAVDLGNVMGVYCTVTRDGEIATGDAIALA